MIRFLTDSGFSTAGPEGSTVGSGGKGDGVPIAVVNSEPRWDGKALAKTEEAPQALPEGIQSLTPEMLDLRKMKHRTPFTTRTAKHNGLN